MMFSHLLVPLDGSPAAEAAVAYANMIPARVVTLMLVVPPADRAGYDWLTAIADDTHHQQQLDHARTYLDGVAQTRLRPGPEVRIVVAEGDPAERIIDASKDTTLILMTNHGQGSSASDAYGRVVDRVIRYAGKPVLVIRDQMAGSTPQLSRVVVPLDGSDLAAEAMPLAIALARQLDVPAHLVSVIDATQAPAAIVAQATKQVTEYLASECERLRAAGVAATTEVRMGTPAAELIATVTPRDLIVMTAFGVGTGQRWLLGGVADKLIRSAPAPVLIVRPTAPPPVEAA